MRFSAHPTLLLSTYAYHTAIGPALYLTAGLLALTIAWITVSLQTLRAARANPVEALQQE